MSRDPLEHAHNVEVERAILAVILDGRHAQAWWTARENGVTPGTFWKREHRLLALVIDAMAQAGEPIDAQTVAAAAKQTRFRDAVDALKAIDGEKPARIERDQATGYEDSLLAGIGGFTALGEIGAASGAATGLERNAQTLVAHAKQRRLIRELSDLAKQAAAPDGAGKVGSIADQAVNRICEIAGGGRASRTLADCGAAVLAEHDAMRASGVGRITGSWGLPGLDTHLPLNAGRMITLAADPGGGKTSLSLQAFLATSAKLGPGSVALINMEQPGTEIASILIAREIGVAKKSLDNGWLDERQRTEADRALEGWRRQEAYVRDNAGGSTMGDLAGWIHQRHQRSGGRLHLVVIDYLQIIEATAKSTQYQTISANTRAIKQLANRLGLCVLLLAQINREGRKGVRDKQGEVTAQPEPRMADLSGSGTIEQDSDAVLLLWNRTPHEGPTASITMIGAKNRGGAQFRLETEFRKAEGQVFKQVETARTPPPRSDVRARAIKVESEATDAEDLFA